MESQGTTVINMAAFQSDECFVSGVIQIRDQTNTIHHHYFHGGLN